MKEILYAKYNRTRRRDFQTKVEIIQDGDKRFVCKTALKSEAEPHVQGLLSCYESCQDYYKDIKLVRSYAYSEGVACDFVKGKSLTTVIEEEIKAGNDTALVIKKYLDAITEVSVQYVCQFQVSDAFKKIFTGTVNNQALQAECDINKYQDKAFTIANIDSIFDNFILTESGIVAIDYEWMLPICIPVDFIKYRTLKHFFLNVLGGIGDFTSFAVENGLNAQDIPLWDSMEEDFQQYVHGHGRCEIYTNNYLKPTIDNKIEERLRLTENHVNNLEALVAAKEAQVNKYKKAVKNPAYGAYLVAKKIVPEKAKKGLRSARHEGIVTAVYRTKNRKTNGQNYERWIKAQMEERSQALKKVKLDYKPLISVLVPVYNVKAGLLKECIESVINQSYSNWQLCLVDDCSTMEETKAILRFYQNNPKIDVAFRKENGHISRTTNQALEMAKGEFVALLDCDDLLTKDALLEMVAAINSKPQAEFLYSDEDKIDEEGKMLFYPYFKPDWSPDTIMNHMYTCHLGVYKTEIVRSIGGLRVGYEGSQDYDLVLRLMEVVKAENIVHVPYILYHWRTRIESTAGGVEAKPYIMDATQKAKLDAFERRGIKAEIEPITELNQYRVRYIPNGDSKVSIVIPSKDNPEILRRCLASIRNKTVYSNYEIIVVDNGSSEENKARYSAMCNAFNCRYIYNKMEFNFSKMCNDGVAQSTGDYIVLLNDDIEVIDGQWMDRMLGQAELPHVGAVGAKLYYPDSTIMQHAGVINLPPGPAHALTGLDDNIVYYMGINRYDCNFIAVTAACLMVSKEKYLEVEGLYEGLKVAYNDVDFCFKLLEAGYYNVMRNDVKLYHHESYSRGDDTLDLAKIDRLNAERAKLYYRHPDYIIGEHMDPFYNHNLIQTATDYQLNTMNANRDSNIAYSTSHVSKFAESDDILGNCEAEFISGEKILIRGYAVDRTSKRNNSLKVKVLFIKPDGKTYVFATEKEYRPDQAGRFGIPRLGMIGYILLTDIKDVDFSDCRVAVAFGKKLKYV